MLSSKGKEEDSMATYANTHEMAELRVQRGFLAHVGVFIVVNAGLAALNMTRNPDKLWILWVIGGWGLGVLFHAARVFLIPGAHERMVERTEARIERRQMRRSE
jgi:hypothetical protein